MAIPEMAFDPVNGLKDPTWNPTQPDNDTALREKIQAMSDQLRDYINDTLLGKLYLTTEGSSGAKQIGVSTITGITGNDVQTVLANLLTVAQAAQAGTILPGVVTDLMLSNTAGQIKDLFTAHLADYVKHCPYIGTTAGTGNAYTVTAPGLTALENGVGFKFMVDRNSTGNTTINPNGLGAKNIVDSFGNIVTNIKQYVIYSVSYNGTNFILLGKGGDYGNVTAPYVASGITFGTEMGVETGTGVQAKRWAKGAMSYSMAPNESQRDIYIASGLSFTPSVVFWYTPNFTSGYGVISAVDSVFATIDPSYHRDITMEWNNGNGYIVGSSNTLVSDGFYLQFSNQNGNSYTGNVYWIAIEL